ncbi:MAG: amidohydrolase [Gammaproteobacteria bacterium]|nr:amidohydrolase [Rhodocyclaceae bacterium]MBU3910947.1 amidohydrolase [Gammaproteobacteria bacterium]MBU3989723.1 amidohydrolase [Gammaproteobacteria bacterium]MBU4003701.1 amidohydrolase [Gammaproteobacteria bacterium]MBU4098008.1 amidohydrolase [Gammaproteobacteria bacterium]
MDLNGILPELVARIASVRRDLHAHPELAFAETRTSEVVANHLKKLGLEVHEGMAGTGVVARLKLGNSPRAIGLRADMDALPLPELNTFPHRSRHPDRMHACGHDGHTAMLLGAAEALKLLSASNNFDGTVYFIFQPAEEHEGGGRVMVEEGLFERFPMQMVFGLHNWPGLAAGSMAVMEGPVMAGADRFEIIITARGAHAAMPHLGTDAILAGADLVQAVQSLVSRATDPQEAAVVSVTRFHAGHADNILPEQAVLGGTVRTFRVGLQDALEEGLGRICTGIEATHRVRAELHFSRGYPPTINAAEPTAVCRQVARQIVGDEHVFSNMKPSMGAEDFAYLANAVPGCYVWLGNGSGEGGCLLHSPHYDFNDEIIATGIRYWVRLVETTLARQ